MKPALFLLLGLLSTPPLCLSAASPAALDTASSSPRLLPDRPSLWPAGDGYEIRSSQLRLRYSAEGAVLGSEVFPKAGTRARPTVFALPADASGEAVAVAPLAPGSRTPQCVREPAADGGSTELRLSRLSYEGIFLDPPPPGPPIPDYLDDSTEARRVMRDADGVIYALASGFGGPLLVFAPDCERLDTAAHAAEHTSAIAARAEHRGAYRVLRLQDAFRLQRLEGLAPQWSWSSETLVDFDAAEFSAQVWMTRDGSALLALQSWTQSRIHLLRFAADGRLLASATLVGRQIAALAEREERLLLALTQDAGSAILALDATLAVRASSELAGLRIHGSVSSAEHGWASPVWLLSDYRGELGRAPWVGGIAYAAVSANVQAGLESLSPLTLGRRPIWVERSGSVLAMEELDGRWHLFRRWADGTEQQLPDPQTPETDRALVHAAISDAFGSLALTLGPASGALRLSAWDTEGRARWSRDVAGFPLEGRALPARMSADAPSCLAYRDSTSAQPRLACFASGDGALVFDRTWLAPSNYPNVQAGIADASGRVRLLVLRERAPAEGYSLGLVEVAATGDLREDLLAVNVSHPLALASVVAGAQVAVGVDEPDASGRLQVDLAAGTHTLRTEADASLSWRPVAVDASGRSLFLAYERGGQSRLLDMQVLDRRLQLLGRPALEAGALASATVQSTRRYAWALDVEAGRVMAADPGEGSITLLSLPLAGASGARQVRLAIDGNVHWLALEPSESAGVWQLAAAASERLEQRGVELHSLRVSAPRQVRVAAGTGSAPAFASFSLSMRGLVSLHQDAISRAAVDSPVWRVEWPLEDRPPSAEHSGLWYDPQSTGQGLMLDVEAPANRWFAAWFSFQHPGRPDGAANQRLRPTLRWYSLLGRGDGAAAMPVEAQVFASAGGRFDGGAPQTAAQGQASLRAIDCNTLEFTYSISDADDAAVPVLTGARRLQRLGPAPAVCGGASLAEQSGLHAASTGSWVLEGRPSQGVLMQVDPGVAGGAGAVWGAWFGFDAGEPDDALAQHWLTVVGRRVAGQPGVVELEWMRTLGGSFDARPTRNTTVIGSGRLRFTACDRAVLEYSFAAPGLPGDAFAGLQGQVNLRRFEPCP